MSAMLAQIYLGVVYAGCSPTWVVDQPKSYEEVMEIFDTKVLVLPRHISMERRWRRPCSLAQTWRMNIADMVTACDGFGDFPLTPALQGADTRVIVYKFSSL